MSLTWYLANIFYDAIGLILDSLASYAGDRPGSMKQLMSIGFWPGGGDRDGNPFGDTDVTRDVARKLCNLIVSCYHINVRELKRRFSFAGVFAELETLQFRLHQELSGDPATPIAVAEMLELLQKIERIVAEKYQGLFVGRLHSLRRKLSVFGLHFASLDIRQDSRVIKSTLDTILAAHQQLLTANFASLPETDQIERLLQIKGSVQAEELSDPIVLDTLRSLHVIREIQLANGEAGCHRCIISNCSGVMDIVRLIALFRLTGWDMEKLSVDIIPLFESIRDLNNAGKHMARLYAFQDYRQHLRRRANQQTSKPANHYAGILRWHQGRRLSDGELGDLSGEGRSHGSVAYRQRGSGILRWARRAARQRGRQYLRILCRARQEDRE
ncbi:MAG: phosphoenolpyruvate carboxylase [Gammaproteobacteria bacterium]|nr:phosphoenolpyruvate carboxylase [Gammaproteobacteria bacterium]